ncbi:MAG: hypothetical protein K2K83_00365, partial [Rikenella sp.]|nr:hypothetical protein [Rikenella sp.]
MSALTTNGLTLACRLESESPTGAEATSSDELLPAASGGGGSRDSSSRDCSIRVPSGTDRRLR